MKLSLGSYQETALTSAAGFRLPAVAPATITSASNATPIVVTSAAHGLATGAVVIIDGAIGNTAANGSWQITVIDANTFSLKGSVGNGPYGGSGTWRQIPPGVQYVLLSAEGQNVRWRDDGGLPSAATGNLILAGEPPFIYDGLLTKFKAIGVASGAKLNIEYWRVV